MRMTSVVLVLFWMGMALNVFAHDGHTPHNHAVPAKTWTTKSGETFKGFYVRTNDGQVTLDLADGYRHISLAELSDQDRSWIELRQTQIEMVNRNVSEKFVSLTGSSKSDGNN